MPRNNQKLANPEANFLDKELTDEERKKQEIAIMSDKELIIREAELESKIKRAEKERRVVDRKDKDELKEVRKTKKSRGIEQSLTAEQYFAAAGNKSLDMLSEANAKYASSILTLRGSSEYDKVGEALNDLSKSYKKLLEMEIERERTGGFSEKSNLEYQKAMKEVRKNLELVSNNGKKYFAHKNSKGITSENATGNDRSRIEAVQGAVAAAEYISDIMEQKAAVLNDTLKQREDSMGFSAALNMKSRAQHDMFADASKSYREAQLNLSGSKQYDKIAESAQKFSESYNHFAEIAQKYYDLQKDGKETTAEQDKEYLDAALKVQKDIRRLKESNSKYFDHKRKHGKWLDNSTGNDKKRLDAVSKLEDAANYTDSMMKEMFGTVGAKYNAKLWAASPEAADKTQREMKITAERNELVDELLEAKRYQAYADSSLRKLTDSLITTLNDDNAAVLTDEQYTNKLFELRNAAKKAPNDPLSDKIISLTAKHLSDTLYSGIEVNEENQQLDPTRIQDVNTGGGLNGELHPTMAQKFSRAAMFAYDAKNADTPELGREVLKKAMSEYLALSFINRTAAKMNEAEQQWFDKRKEEANAHPNDPSVQLNDYDQKSYKTDIKDIFSYESIEEMAQDIRSRKDFQKMIDDCTDMDKVKELADMISVNDNGKALMHLSKYTKQVNEENRIAQEQKAVAAQNELNNNKAKNMIHQ